MYTQDQMLELISVATAAIHDWRYEHSDGLPESQKIKYRHANGGLWGWLCRLWDERKVIAAYRFLEVGGEGAWCISFRNNVLKLN